MSSEVVNALSKAVGAIDSSRRVGWAKAYAAEASADEAHRIAALTAEDRTAYRRGASYLWGVVTGLTSGMGVPDLKDDLFTETGELDQILDGRVVDRGVRAGQRMAAQRVEAEERAAQKAEVKRSSRRLHESWGKGRRRGVADVARKYGFTDAAQMEHVLAKWQEVSGGQPHREDVRVGRYLVGPSGRERRTRDNTEKEI